MLPFAVPFVLDGGDDVKWLPPADFHVQNWVSDTPHTFRSLFGQFVDGPALWSPEQQQLWYVEFAQWRGRMRERVVNHRTLESARLAFMAVARARGVSYGERGKLYSCSSATVGGW